jgi:outer membrane protein TolC
LEAKANVAAARKARRATRRWFFSARDGFNSGLGEAKEMIDAVKEYSIIRAKYHAEVYHFNRAWARLQKVTGHSLVP